MDALRSVGMVVRQALPTPVFLGSCFPFRDRFAFLTAAHVVGTLEPAAVVLSLPFHGPARGLYVDAIIRHETADVAIIRARPADDEPVVPYTDLVSNLGYGEEFVAFGFPEDIFGENPRQPTPRMFRGHFQRIFPYRSPLGYSYEALELSTPCPGGLSGGPVFRPGAPTMVTGVVAENLESQTYLSAVEEVQQNGGLYREVHKAVVNYGVAVALRDVQPWLDSHVPRP